MPTLVELFPIYNNIVRLQSNLVDFTVTGETSFENQLSVMVDVLNNAFVGADYCFKPSKLSLVVKEAGVSSGTFPIFSVGDGTGVNYGADILSSTDFTTIPLDGADTYINFDDLEDYVFRIEDLTVKVETASTQYDPFAGYFVLEGSFINTNL